MKIFGDCSQVVSELNSLPFSESGVPVVVSDSFFVSSNWSFPMDRPVVLLSARADSVRFFVDAGVPVNNVVLFGVCLWSSDSIAVSRNIQKFSMFNIVSEGLENVCDAFMAQALSLSSFVVVVDSHIEPGSLSARDLLYVVQRLRLLRNFVGGGVVFERDARLCARLLVELACRNV